MIVTMSCNLRDPISTKKYFSDISWLSKKHISLLNAHHLEKPSSSYWTIKTLPETRIIIVIFRQNIL